MVSRTVGSAIAVHTYEITDYGIHQALKTTFEKGRVSIMFSNPGNYAQRVQGSQKMPKSKAPLAFDEAVNVFEVLLWFNCINKVYDR